MKQLYVEGKKYFKAGELKNHKFEWHQITYDKRILDFVNGINIIEKDDAIDKYEVSSFVNNFKFSDVEKNKISQELENMLTQGIITESSKEEGDIILNIFAREKSDGINLRIILNLKKLNNELTTNKF